MTFAISAQPAVQEQTSRKRGPCKTDVSAVKKRSRGKGGPAAHFFFHLKKEDILNETIPATTTSLPEAAMEAVAVLLKVMKWLCAVYDVDFREVLKTHEDAVGECLA